MPPTDTIAREHPLNEVETWQRLARLWDADSRRRDNDTPQTAAGYRDECLHKLMVAEETLERAEYDPIGNGPIWRTE